MIHRFFLLCATLVFFPLAGLAQEYPNYENTLVNDYADLLDPAQEQALKDDLQSLRDGAGVEMTVLTIATRADFTAGGSLEDFATGLFNTWGIGDPERHDGILIMVVRDDREMRIELGAGYGPGYDSVAASIIRTDFLPAFRNGEYASGILAGTDAVIRQIARRHASGQPAPEPPEQSRNPAPLLAILVFGVVGTSLVATLFGRRIRNRLRRCPQCGQRGMLSERKVLEKPTRKRKGRGEETLTCSHCAYSTTLPYTIGVISSSSGSSSGGSFGGGSSAGGGASGSW